MDELIVKKINSTMILQLNREKVLNALNLNMVRIISSEILNWKNDDSISGVLLRGSGDKSFCAGGDIVSVYHKRNISESNLSYDFFREEYLLNYEISKFGKPWISLLNGIAMGGGLGLSVHGSHRILSEKTIAAMPETAIGLFPDVGGSYFLSRMKGSLGIYLALTGKTIDGKDSMFANIGTHLLNNSLVEEFVNKLLKLKNYSHEEVDLILDEISLNEKLNSNLVKELELINRHYNKGNIHEIFSSLEKDQSEWCVKQLNILNKKSPTSMGVTTRQLNLAKELSLKKCLSMEFRICQAMMQRHDFYEGVRANLVDKDRKPKCNPKNVYELSNDAIEEHFKNLGERELFKDE